MSAGKDRAGQGDVGGVAVAGHAAYEGFLTERLSGLPAVMHLESHLAMKKIKAES